MMPQASRQERGYRCQLCLRRVRQATTEHHLIPRTCHSNKWFRKRFSREEMQETVSLCRDCHRSIHKLIPSEKELGRDYHTIEALRAHDQLGKFIHWVRKQR